MIEAPRAQSIDTAAEAESRLASRGKRLVFDAGSAQLAAWCALAFLNQILIGVCLPPAPWRVALLHRAYDAGQLLALGVLSLVSVKLAGFALDRLPTPSRIRRWAPALTLGTTIFAVSTLVVRDDVANMAERHEVEPWILALAASLALSAGLTSSLVLRRFARGWMRPSLLLLGILIAIGNALVLENDYFGLHLVGAWLAALILGHALEGRKLPGFGSRAGLVAAGHFACAGAAALLLTPRSEVLRRLYALPSAVVAPLAARFLPEQRNAELTRVLPEYLTSPWFHDRSRLPAVPPTGALTPPEAPIVVLFTIDAVRADVLTNNKHRRKLPELTNLIGSSSYFTEARSPTPATTTTMASIFSGKYFSMLPWLRLGKGKVRLTEKTPRLAELLSRAKVRTIHVTSLGRLRAASGVGIGFEKEIGIVKTNEKAAAIIDAISEQLSDGAPGPTFVYAHFTEPHAPYDLAGKKGKPFDRYVREIALVDRQIARFRDILRSRGLDRRAVLVITSDHGEAFGEHGQQHHARSVYEELIHVPLIIHVPGVPARKIDTPVTLMDIGPTVLDLFGLPTPGFHMGQSLSPLMAGQRAELTRPIVADAGRRIQALYFPDGKKVIFERIKKTTEVYDLEADPGELVNLVESNGVLVDAQVQTGQLFFDVIRLKQGETAATVND